MTKIPNALPGKGESVYQFISRELDRRGLVLVALVCEPFWLGEVLADSDISVIKPRAPKGGR